MAAGKLVGFQVCPHLNDSNTQVFITLKNDNQLQGGITLMHFLFDFLAWRYHLWGPSACLNEN